MKTGNPETGSHEGTVPYESRERILQECWELCENV